MKHVFSFLVASTLVSGFLLTLPAHAKDLPQHGPAIVPAYMENSVRPGDEFYLYANGTWEKNTQMRPDRAFESPASDIYDQHEQKLQDLIQHAAKAQDANSRRIADLYRSYMDEAAIEAAGMKPSSHSSAIAANRDKRQLSGALGKTLRADDDALNKTNFHTDNLFGCGWRLASTTPITTMLT